LCHVILYWKPKSKRARLRLPPKRGAEFLTATFQPVDQLQPPRDQPMQSPKGYSDLASELARRFAAGDREQRVPGNRVNAAGYETPAAVTESGVDPAGVTAARTR